MVVVVVFLVGFFGEVGNIFSFFFHQVRGFARSRVGGMVGCCFY